ncbi:MAG: hypothetical protein HDT42_10290 [Ruminococcaceae bacterium]|nr:hypothetical protein [Oscillospiraceae bacterium]
MKTSWKSPLRGNSLFWNESEVIPMPDNTNGKELDEYAAALCREINGL